MIKHLSPALASLPLIVALCAITGEPLSYAHAGTLYGLTTSRQLARIDTDQPGRASALSIEGIAQGERLLSLTYAPPSPDSLAGTLYAIGSKGTLYGVSADTARATALGQLSADAAGGLASGTFALLWTGASAEGSAGASFNLLSSKGLNLSLALGTGGLSFTRGANLSGAALGLSSASRVGSTTYALNTKTASLLEMPSAGVPVAAAPLEVDTFGVSGLVLGADGSGWAALLEDSGVSALYGVSLAGAILQARGEISLADGTPLAPIAALVEAPGLLPPSPSVVPEPSTPALVLAGLGAAWMLGRRRSPRAAGSR